MTVYGDGPEYQAYMREWMDKHPGPWVQCRSCRGWYQSKVQPKPGKRCAICPPKQDAGAELPQKAPHLRGSRDRREWGNYS